MKIILSESQIKRLIKEELSADVVKNHGAMVYTDSKNGDDLKNKKLIVTLSLDKLIKNQKTKDEDKVDYKERIGGIVKALKKKKNLGPIIVFKDGDKYRILDGNHRYEAYKKLKKDTIDAIVIPKKNVTIKKKWSKEMDKEFKKIDK
jgi:uncharacterized ParB-like nuclease family protein